MNSEGLFQQQRNRMVQATIARRGVLDCRVLDAMNEVPRHNFVLPHYLDEAYEDSSLPIGHGQTISQPYIVALMAESAQLQPTDKVLEIGTGCGYSAAVLSRLAQKVHTVESVPTLHEGATSRLKQLGYDNITCHLGDGSVGLASEAPFDAIIVTAGAPRVPQTLKAQLTLGGRLVIPVASALIGEDLLRITKVGEHSYTEEKLTDVAFVPLLGEEGWK
jgi:protein-L-isoaspartate(D-aspartate) O-methyltransferase